MAGIGLHGFYCAKATITTGEVTAYSTWKKIGNAISVDFSPAEGTTNNLWSDNHISESDTRQGSGGELTYTLDRLTEDAYVDLFGYTLTSSTVTVNSSSVTGTGFAITGDEQSNPVGTGYVIWNQENNDRNKYRAVVFRNVTFKPPAANGATMTDTIEWQTPEIVGTVVGKEGDGTKPWIDTRTFPTEAAAVKFITSYTA